MELDLSDGEDEPGPTIQKRLCVCASRPQEISQSAGQPQSKDFGINFPYHTKQITDDYTVSHEIIGIGESGKVMACYSKIDGKKYALKVLRDGPKSRREVYLHYLSWFVLFTREIINELIILVIMKILYQLLIFMKILLIMSNVY